MKGAKCARRVRPSSLPLPYLWPFAPTTILKSLDVHIKATLMSFKQAEIQASTHAQTLFLWFCIRVDCVFHPKTPRASVFPRELSSRSFLKGMTVKTLN